MRKRGKQGQAALEYLTTYGWVFLVVIIGVGALAYFGFLNPQKFVPDRCWFGSQLICEDYAINKIGAFNSDLRWKVRNTFSKDIEIIDIRSVDSNYVFTGCTTGMHIGVGKVQELSCAVTDPDLFQGDKYAFSISINFSRNDTVTAPVHVVSGEVFTRVN